MTGQNGKSPVVRFLAWLLMGVGVLVALTTGACTLYVLAGLIANGTGGYGGVGEWIGLSLVIGGLPCLIGVALFFGGRRLGRPAPARVTPPVMERDDEPTTGA